MRVQVTVPSGVTPGMKMRVNYSGSLYDIVVPPGYNAGSLLTVEIPVQQSAPALPVAAPASAAATVNTAEQLESEARKVFGEFDRDGNGYIDRAELSNIMVRLSISGDVNNLMTSADYNGDGKLDFTEFVHLYNHLKKSSPQSGSGAAIAQQQRLIQQQQQQLILAQQQQQQQIIMHQQPLHTMVQHQPVMVHHHHPSHSSAWAFGGAMIGGALLGAALMGGDDGRGWRGDDGWGDDGWGRD